MLVLLIALGAVAVVLLGALLVTVWRYACYRESHPFTREYRERDRERTRKLTAATRTGQTVEQLAPYLAGFRFKARDARFLSGGPIDYVIFDGLDEGDLREIVLLEIKSGAPRLNPRQQQVQAAVDEGRVRFEIAQVLKPEPSADQPEPPPDTPERTPITRTAGGLEIVQLPRRRRRSSGRSVGA
jgi:hypothetical protein